MEKILLTHGLENMELASLEVLGHKALIINEENGGANIGEIIEGGKKKTMAPLPDEKVIIFYGYTDDELQKEVQNFRKIFEVRPILAVVTVHSINWPFEYLLNEHLIKDRNANRENHKKYLEELEEENRRMKEES